MDAQAERHQEGGTVPKRTKQIKRVKVGPLDFVSPHDGVAARLFDNRLTRRFSRADDQQRVSNQGRVSRSDLERLAKSDPEAAAIVERISGLTWYHTLDLGHGVQTPGFVDHRPQLPLYDLPQSMAGKRCLDVATFDGYWAFEFERRGSTDVVAIDIDSRLDMDCPRWALRDPAGFDLVDGVGNSFSVAQSITGSKVQRVTRSVYDLDPAVDGMFDFVFVSDVLLHLRDPQLALERAYSVCRGEIVVADVFSPELEALGDVPVAQFLAPGETWWYQNVACLRRMMTVAGFEPISEVNRFVLDAVGDNEIHKVVLRGTAASEPSWTVQTRAEIARKQANRAEFHS